MYLMYNCKEGKIFDCEMVMCKRCFNIGTTKTVLCWDYKRCFNCNQETVLSEWDESIQMKINKEVIIMGILEVLLDKPSDCGKEKMKAVTMGVI